MGVFKIINHKSTILNILWWTFVAIMAIVLVEINAVLGLIVAIVGGIILGIRLFAK